ncbi:MAG: S8 family serine peptidase [Candidatus Lokiarchaeota archaeon]|nr:S8 family serine peptidase [Candidatus Lokiarchaeota archaeon]
MRKPYLIIIIFIVLPISQFLIIGIFSYNISHPDDLHLTSWNVDNSLQILPNKLEISSTFNASDHIGLRDTDNEYGLTGNNITVAVVDTGIFSNHSVITNDGKLNWNDRIITYVDFINNKSSNPQDDNGHGTWTASILGGNSSEYRGVAPGIKFVILKIFDSSGETNTTIFENAVNWILLNKDILNIKIVSMSFGAKPEANNIYSILYLQKLTRRLADIGILVIAAAGNDGNPNLANGDGTINAPASDKAIFAVGGVDYDGNMYPYSAEGPTIEMTRKPDVCAPAVAIYGADIGFSNSYSFRSGTSGATPFVAGLAALMLEKDETLTPSQLKSIISLTSLKTTNPRVFQDNIQGWGVVQGYAALDALEPPVLINVSTEIEFFLNEDYSVYCLPIRLAPNHYYFELAQLGLAKAEMYLYHKETNVFGIPKMISNTINQIIPDRQLKRLGVFTSVFQDYFLLVKLLNNESGNFIVRLVFEYGNIIFMVLLGINIIGLVYARILYQRVYQRDIG